MTITRSTVFGVAQDAGHIGLSQAIDRECNRIENDGNRIVAISHASLSTSWSVIILYTKPCSAGKREERGG